ncbi:MAG: 3-oxoacyl-(acyl-carrier-protein) synthase III [Porticoccaceae bacterium]|jgi:3-oxoacyl-(acyl-carrier-protein) synthase III
MNYHSSMRFQSTTTTKTANTKILSVGSYLPEQRLKSDDIMSEIKSDVQYDIPINWMSESMGIIERRISPASSKPSDLAIPAAQKAIEHSNINPDLIDLVIFCGIERDHSEPATAHIVQASLKLSADHAFDISNACFGFMHAIEIANHFLQSGTVRYALVCTGEVPSKILLAAIEYLKSGVAPEIVQKTLGALTVGDAGGAVILGLSDVDEDIGFKLFHTKTDSSHVKKCFYEIGPDGTFNGQMEMGRIVGASIWMHRKIINETLLRLGWNNFDWVLSHQTGKRPFEKFQSFSTVDTEHMIKTYDTLANITSATFPINFEKLLNTGKLRSGERIGGIHSGSGLVIGEFGYQM